MSDYQEDIDFILDNFDFERVKKAMDALNWSYFDSEDGIVTVFELRKMARYVLKSLVPHADRKEFICGCGGFHATVNNYEDIDKPIFKLQFVLEEWENEY